MHKSGKNMFYIYIYYIFILVIYFKYYWLLKDYIKVSYIHIQDHIQRWNNSRVNIAAGAEDNGRNVITEFPVGKQIKRRVLHLL